MSDITIVEQEHGPRVGVYICNKLVAEGDNLGAIDAVKVICDYAGLDYGHMYADTDWAMDVWKFPEHIGGVKEA